MLTEAQHRAREGKLTGSKVRCLMEGNAEKIMRLYQEMIGEVPPEDLSMVWPVRRGEATEQLNCDWYEQKNRSLLIRRGEFITHRKYPWAGVTLDAWINELWCPFEAKDVGGREPTEVVVDRYQPQVHWIMECTEAEQCALSMIIGGNEPIVEYIPYNHDYAAELMARAKQFMEHVWNRTPPVEIVEWPPVTPPAVGMEYQMAGNNVWGDAAAQWLATKEAAVECKDAEIVLKSMVPPDARKCHGNGVRITRDRAGRLSLREDKE